MASGIPSELQALYQVATQSREKAYSPYSQVKVGAAIRTTDGKIYGGCNMENSSYGATVCAERVAIGKAISEGSKRISDVLVVTDASPGWPPCGMCRQVIAEFSDPSTRIHVTNLKSELQTFSFNELVPHAFTPGHLLKP